ncbi:hypothetical protein [Nocardia barduliensis]|uniref:hypothetical protein n=1 Tax=Nocardia barduliensis TaxID=2736643 RepID=UPI00157250A9|nr:hypothetical protein [Nocardia barduliensis]
MTEMFRLRAQTAGADYIIAASSVADAQAQLRQIAQQLSATHRRVATLAFAGHGAGANGDFLIAVAGSPAHPSRELIDDSNFANLVAPLFEAGDLLDSAVQVRLEGCWTENGPLPRAIDRAFAQQRVSATVSGFAGAAEFTWSPPAPGARRPRRGPAGTVTVTGTSLNDL